MSLVSEMIELAATYSGLSSAFDLSETDPATLVTPKAAGSQAASVAFNSVSSVGPNGVVLSAIDDAVFTTTSGVSPVQFIFVGLPSTDTFSLLSAVVNTRPFNLTVDAGYPKLAYLSGYDNSNYSQTHTQSIVANKINVLSYYITNREFEQNSSIGLGQAGGEFFIESKLNNRGTYYEITSATIFGAEFSGTASALLVFNRVLSEVELSALFAKIGIYGNIVLPTNLEGNRTQSGVVLRPDRTIDGTFTVSNTTSDLSYYSMAESGSLLQFVAFDTDAGKSILTTQEVLPTSVSVLEFSAASGGGEEGNGTQAHIAGSVVIDGSPAAREVIVIKDDPAGRQVVAEGVSASDGTFDISYSGWNGSVIALALDKYGQAFAAETPLNQGTIIHPTTPSGYVYEVSVAGTTGITEPVWSTDDSIQSGSVTFQPKPYYRPIASGPIQGEVTFVEQDYWFTVLSLEPIALWTFAETSGNTLTDSIADIALSPADSTSLTYDLNVSGRFVDSSGALLKGRDFAGPLSFGELQEWSVVFHTRKPDRLFASWFSIGTNGSYGLYIEPRSGSNDINVILFTGAYTFSGALAGYATNQWLMISIVFNGNALSLYIEGDLIGSKTYAGTRRVNFDRLYLGVNNQYDATNWKHYSAFSIFNRVLTAQEIANLHAKALEYEVEE